MDRHIAEEWVHEMKNRYVSIAPHWNMEQVKQIMQQNSLRAITTEIHEKMKNIL